MMRIMPRPQMLLMTIMMIATSAIGQFVSQLAMAELARISPMQMTMGPVTTGGKNRMMRCGSNALNSADTTKYKSPAQATPRQA